MFAGVVILLVVGIAGVAVAYGIDRATAVSATPMPALAFGSGWRPQEHALSRFHARYYPLTLLFLAFDVEMLYMYPWATIVAQVGTSAVVEMFAFLVVLLVGVLWAWREGALEWT